MRGLLRGEKLIILTCHFQRLSEVLKNIFAASRVNHCPGVSVTSRSHDDLLSRGNVAPRQVRRHLITTNLSEFL